MIKSLFSAMLVLGALSQGLQSSSAQPAVDLNLGSGDTITWTPNSPHRVRFGGPAVNHGGTMVNLTPFSDIQQILDLNPPPPPPDPSGIVSYAAGQVVNATVKPNAVGSGVTEFNFTCGFVPHYGLMVTVPFKIVSKGAGQPARNLQIETPGIFWALKTPQGDQRVSLP
jgi:hypothetical protein